MKLKNIIEVLIHSSPTPVTSKDISHVLNNKNAIDLSKIIKEINKEYQNLGKGYRIEKISGGYQLLSIPDYHPYIERLQQKIRKPRFSRAAIETLSIIAYKQPLTRGEVEDIVERRTIEMSRSGIKPSGINEMSIRYQKAFKIALQWINNYVNLEFRSLGSYTRGDLDSIAEREDAF